jgi:hypothetical protein
MASSANRMAAAVTVCKSIIACFGLPTVSADVALQIAKANVWDDMANNLCVAFAEGLAGLGILGSLITFGAPAFLLLVQSTYQSLFLRLLNSTSCLRLISS